VKTRTQIDETHWKEAYAWYDGLGRATRSQTVDPDGDIVVDTEYDVMSRPFKVTNPYRLDTSSPFGPAETVYWTERVFDAAGRPWKTITSDDAVVETTYSLSTSGTLGTAVTVEDQADKLRRSITNSLGHLVRVDEPNNSGLGSIASPNQPTPYTYDLLNNLTQVAQAGDSNDECGPSTTTCSQTRTFTYDALSRLKQAVNPESGTINYTYDANGNIATKTDARGIVTTYTYDTLNRVTQRAYATPSPTPSNYSATPTVNYYYDNLTNATGKLIKVESSVSTTEYSSFDILGRVTASKQTTDGVTYGDGTATSAMTYSYNLSGALIEQQYPSGQKVKNTIDSNGDLAMVQSRKNSAAGYWSYANSFSYNAAGAVTSMQLGNGRWESMTFNERLQPTQIALGTTPGAANLLDLGYTYGTTANNGNVLTQTITVPTVGANTGFTAVQTYNYDPVNRLKDATEMITPHGGSQTQSWKQVFSFDRYGNRNFVTGSGQTTTLGSCPTAVCNPSIDPSNNRLTASTYGYNFDSAGNTTRDASDRKFTYDGENKQTKVESLTTGTNSVTGTVGEYFYDGDGKRVKKYVPKPDPEPDEVTIFVYDAAGKLIEEFSSDVASSTEAQVAYVTHDSLGSRRINTDENGAVTSRLDYYPFGEEIPGDGISARAAGLEYQNDSIRRRFSGKERDDETSLDYFLARYYSPVLGRFASADPILVSTKQVIHPQTWNLYNYVNNNPLAYVDPTGMERIRLGQHTDDEINERTNAIEREKQGIQNDASLSEEDKQSKMAVLDAEATNLQMEKIANNAVSSYLAALDLVGERQGLKVSDFTLSTDSKNDFASVPGAGDPGKGATFFMVLGHSNEIFINQNSQIYQASLGNVTRLDGDGKQIPTADLNIYMGAAGIHERSHRDSPTRDLQKSEGRAYTEQLRVLQKFGPNAFVSKDFFYQAAGFIMNGTERP
jgi:RHS repeat-associated protein